MKMEVISEVDTKLVCSLASIFHYPKTYFFRCIFLDYQLGPEEACFIIPSSIHKTHPMHIAGGKVTKKKKNVSSEFFFLRADERPRWILISGIIIEPVEMMHGWAELRFRGSYRRTGGDSTDWCDRGGGSPVECTESAQSRLTIYVI